MHENRIREWNQNRRNDKGKYVLYKMQASCRIHYNMALSYAVNQANELNIPLKIVFQLLDNYPEANFRHLSFMCEGLLEFAYQCDQKGYEFILQETSVIDEIQPYLQKASCVVLDKGYLRIQKQGYEYILQNAPCPVVQIEDNVVIPLETVSDKAEWAARTIRPKIKRLYPEYELDRYNKLPIPLKKELRNKTDLPHLEKIINSYLVKQQKKNDLSLGILKGGHNKGKQRFESFLKNRFLDYDQNRNDPSFQGTSKIAAYLHFGQVSPLELIDYLKTFEGKVDMRQMGVFQDALEVWIEQLVVRRELACNYVFYTSNYDTLEALPAWCHKTMKKHELDERPIQYNLKKLEKAQTEDICWNAAMLEMIKTGFLENTMRMYWGKKIMEWSESMTDAYLNMIYLNNKYLLDGRDPNSFVGVGWCFGLHDRPWQERPIFGTIRYMNQQGLFRKYDMDKYIKLFGEHIEK